MRLQRVGHDWEAFTFQGLLTWWMSLSPINILSMLLVSQSLNWRRVLDQIILGFLFFFSLCLISSYCSYLNHQYAYKYSVQLDEKSLYIDTKISIFLNQLVKLESWYFYFRMTFSAAIHNFGCGLKWLQLRKSYVLFFVPKNPNPTDTCRIINILHL